MPRIIVALFLALPLVAGLALAAGPEPAAATAATTLAVDKAGATPAPDAAPASRPHIDVAFCIDTTGSMQAHIDAVKKKVWDVVNGLLKGEPRPVVRLGVVGFRDQKDAYLVKTQDLTEDIDKVHGFLMELKADGGGDEAEHVTAGLRECVDKLTWSDGKKTLKLVYLIGDAPAHTDYPDGDYKPVAKAAASKGINIHTMACSGMNEVAQWKEIASLSDGQFHQMPRAAIARGPARARGGFAGKASLAPAPMSAPMPGAAVDSAAGIESRAVESERGDSFAPEAGAAPAPSAEEAADKMGDTILESIKSEASKKGVSKY